MNYSTDLLTTVAECDASKAEALNQKELLNLELVNLDHDIKHFSSTDSAINSELISTTAELTAQQSAYSSITDPKVKSKTELKIKQLETRKLKLELRDDVYGPTEYLMMENRKARILLEIAEIDSLIAQIDVKKATL